MPYFGFETICIILGRNVSFRKAADHPATFTKINIPTQEFSGFIIGQWFQIAQPICGFFAFSGNSIIRFSGNEFSQDCSGHYSMKSHACEKV